jgi:hypothetical protein
MTAVTETPPVLNLSAPVTWEQYQETLRLFHAAFIADAAERIKERPSMQVRRISPEFPERRNGQVTPDQLYPEVTPEDLTEEGKVKFGELTGKQYAERLATYRRRALSLVGQWWTLGQANRVLGAAGLPGYGTDLPPGNPYYASSFPVVNFQFDGDLAAASADFQGKFEEWMRVNGYVVPARYVLPTITPRTESIPVSEKAALLS